jgi:signal transduction histidine kinase
MSTAPMPARRSRAGTVAILVAGTACAAAFLLDLQVPGSHRDELDLVRGGPDALAGLVLAAAGAWVLHHLPRHPLGWLMAGFGAWWAVDSVAASWLAYATLEQPPLPGSSVAFWVFQRLGSWLLLLLPLVLLLYPDGTLPRGRWRVAALVSLSSTALLPVCLLFAPAQVAQLASETGDLPAPFRELDLEPVTLPIPDELWSGLLRVAFLLVPLSLVVPFVLVVTRYRAASGFRRTQMRWLLWAALMDLLVMLTAWVVPDQVTSWGLTVCVAITAGSVAVGLVRPDLVDVDLLLGSTLVYGALLVVAFAVDVLVLGILGRLLGTQLERDEALVIAVFVVALLYGPLRHRLWRVVRRTALGEREDPYRVVSGLAERLERSDASEVQLLAVARTVGRAFRTPYVGVEIDQVNGDRLLVEDGARPRATENMPITYRGEEIGRLILPVTSRRAGLRRADERLLADVVRQAAAAARTGQLADELQRSRLRLVTAVEDERRRLRNELHDGLGPTMAAIASRVDTARILAARSPEAADRMLGQAREEITGMLAEVRRLVHGLRPPALDDVGLAGAIRQQVERLDAPAPRFVVESSPGLSRLPAAVEVAAYRIVSEAVTNVVRHAFATTCTVRLDVADGVLVVEVDDDGTGIPPAVEAGVGLVSLRERAAELGGRCWVTAAGGGTTVRAELPVPDDHWGPATAGAGEERR